MANQLSGQTTVTTAGTAIQLTAVAGYSFVLTAHPSNSGYVWVGSDGAGDVTSSNGSPLGPGEKLEVRPSNTLGAYWVDADSNGSVLCWLRVE